MRKISLIILGVIFVSIFKSTALAVSGDCGWCGRQCVHLDSAMRCITISPPRNMECVAEGARCVMKSTRALPTLRPTPTVRVTPTVAPENAKCTSFSDDFTGKKLDKEKWYTSSTKDGTMEVLNNELNLVIGNGNAYSYSNIFTKNGPISGDFVIESKLTKVTTEGDKSESVQSLVFNGSIGDKFTYFKIFRINNSPEIFATYFNNNDLINSENKNIGLSSGTPINVKIERIGSIVNFYYDLFDGSGYILLKSMNDVYVGVGHVQILVERWSPDFPSTRAVFDDFKLTCGKVLRKTNKVDVNNDGKIDLVDFDMWKRVYLENRTTAETDFDANGKTNLADFKIWKQFYLSN